MNSSDHVRRMAAYNAWMNAKLYDTAARLSAVELALDRKAFFGSILGTLNHIMVGDILWLKRFVNHPAGYPELDPVRKIATPGALNDMLFSELAVMRAQRDSLDLAIKAWAKAVTDADLDHVLHYVNVKGLPFDRLFMDLVMHFFNHQTHHRGQATTLLTQAGVDVGVTDLLLMIPTEGPS